MDRARLRALSSLALLVLWGALACDGTPDECVGDCVCSGAECTCPDSGDCIVHCGDDCDLSCTGSGNCDFVCDVACTVGCRSSGDCLVDVRADSSVSCTGSGDCEVTCHGDCSVDCPGSGVCLVRCLDGGFCDVSSCDGEVVECDPETLVCGGACPAP